MSVRYIPILAVLTVLLFGTPQLTAEDKDKQADPYGTAGQQAETAKATKVVKLTVVNNSGKEVLFVSWRHWGPDFNYHHTFKDKESVTLDNFAAEWRVNGVWDSDGNSTPGWGQAYHFEKDTTITIEKDKLDIK